MADINDGKITRIPDGSILTITPAGGVAVTIANIIAGTMRWLPPVFATLPPDMDRGVLLADIREGDQLPGEFDFDVKHTADAGVTQLYEELVIPSADGFVPSFTVALQIPDYRGAATGVSYTATKAVRREAPEITEGAEYDSMKCRFVFTAGAKASY